MVRIPAAILNIFISKLDIRQKSKMYCITMMPSKYVSVDYSTGIIRGCSLLAIINITKTRPCNKQRFFTAVKMTIFR